jgi:hypothetical protein
VSQGYLMFFASWQGRRIKCGNLDLMIGVEILRSPTRSPLLLGSTGSFQFPPLSYSPSLSMSLSPQINPTIQAPSITKSDLHDNASIDTKLDSRAPSGKMNPAPAVLSTSTPSSIAALLAGSYEEVESLRNELSVFRTRAEKAEGLASFLQTLYSAQSDPLFSNSATSAVLPTLPGSAVIILMDFENRVVRAEVARDEAEATIRVYIENWAKLESYLAAISDSAAEARERYGRIFLEVEQPVLAHIPTVAKGSEFPPSGNHSVSDGITDTKWTPVDPSVVQPPNLSPSATTTSSRRPRASSMKEYHQPETVRKKSRIADDRIGYSGESVC